VAEALLDKILALLASEAPERQIAAAIVLGELGARDKTVTEALAAAASGGIPPVQRHALEALARLASDKIAGPALGAVLTCFASRDEAVRRAAVDAAIAFGARAVGPVRARLAAATDPTERRALDEALGRVGGQDAFAALLAALDTPDIEAARAAVLAARQRIKAASPREKAAYLAKVTRLLQARRSKAAPHRTPGAGGVGMVVGGLKILGFLEDPATIATLLTFARDARQPTAVREEAIVALRFAARGKAAATAGPLVDLAEHAPLELARAALFTLASLAIPTALAPRLRRIAIDAAPERALLALERLAQVGGAPGADALAAVLAATPDRGRAELAARALEDRPEGAPALGRAILSAQKSQPDSPQTVERITLLARLLRPRARSLAGGRPAGKKLARELVSAAVARAARGNAGADLLLPLAREIDRDATSAGLRLEAAKLGKRGADQALGLLRLIGRGADATAADGYALAVAELRAGRREEALAIVEQLLERRFDLASALRGDRQLDPVQRYQIGFALVERRRAAGEEILTDLARGGRGKVASMARAKLKSAGYA
jgi:hypothetical protein